MTTQAPEDNDAVGADPTHRLRLTQELELLNRDYWYDVDHHWGRRAHEFFADNGVYIIKDSVFTGRAQIREFYAWREQRGQRTARHCIVNFRVVPDVRSDRARCHSILMLYAADGEPIHISTPPIQIADVHDDCVYEHDGGWRYVRRQLTALFEGTAPVTLPPV